MGSYTHIIYQTSCYFKFEAKKKTPWGVSWGADISIGGWFRPSSGLLELDLVAEAAHQDFELGRRGGDDRAVGFVAVAADGERFGAGDLLALQRMNIDAGSRRLAGMLHPGLVVEDRAVGEAGLAVGEDDGELRMADGTSGGGAGLVLVHW